MWPVCDARSGNLNGRYRAKRSVGFVGPMTEGSICDRQRSAVPVIWIGQWARARRAEAQIDA
jgi:hypothetical protein